MAALNKIGMRGAGMLLALVPAIAPATSLLAVLLVAGLARFFKT
jgi:hypothetical protein